MDWAGKVAIVTGASSGIGAAVAREFCAQGAKIALVARSVEKLSTLADELNHAAQAAVAVAFPLDVTRHDLLTALPAAVKAHFGRLDFLVNNAGANQRGPLGERSAEELVAILETNLVAPVLLSHAALRLLEPGGVIFNVASLAGKVPVPHEAVYSGSKAGMRAFARALDLELLDAGRGVRVLTVCPGPVDTGFLGEDLAQVPDLVFSQPMSSAEGVARALFALAEAGGQERDIPALSGKLATLGYLSPRLFALLRPVFVGVGARKKARFIARRRITPKM